jgi:hypothetical protein
MVQAASALPALAAPSTDAPEVCFLTGKRFWHQTAFCFWSLCRQAGQPLRAAFFDDGTLDGVLKAECARLFPGSRLLNHADIEAQLDLTLPVSRYPALRQRRLVYPNLRKLTDCHAGNHTWRLVLDSDMLFFRRPDRLLDWLNHPGPSIHMADIHDAYGYSPELMAALVEKKIPSQVNVGICGLYSNQIDWDKIERWCRQLEFAEGTSYYLEQALIAMLLAGQDAVNLPASDYRLMPDDAECRHPSAIMHHYVDLSKRGYYRDAWRHIVKNIP